MRAVCTGVRRNDNFGKLQAGYLFPEACALSPFAVVRKLHLIHFHPQCSKCLCQLRCFLTPHDGPADCKEAPCAPGKAPRRQGHQPGHRRHHRAHPQVHCRGDAGCSGWHGHAGGLQRARPGSCPANLGLVYHSPCPERASGPLYSSRACMPRCSLVCIAMPILKRGKSHSAPPFTRLMAVSAIK